MLGGAVAMTTIGFVTSNKKANDDPLAVTKIKKPKL